MNLTANISVPQETPHKWRRLPLSDDQITEIENAIRSYHQNAGSSSKGKGIEETMEAFHLLCACASLYDDLIATSDAHVLLYTNGEERTLSVLYCYPPDSPGPRGRNASDLEMEIPGSNQSSDEGNT